MTYYKTCPECGNNLDPGEICDCKRNLMSDEATKIYVESNGDPVAIMNRAFKLGCQKSEQYFKAVNRRLIQC